MARYRVARSHSDFRPDQGIGRDEQNLENETIESIEAEWMIWLHGMPTADGQNSISWAEYFDDIDRFIDENTAYPNPQATQTNDRTCNATDGAETQNSQRRRARTRRADPKPDRHEAVNPPLHPQDNERFPRILDPTVFDLGTSSLQRCIRYLGDNIIQAISHNSWFQSATLFHSPEFIDRHVSAALKEFADDLAKDLPFLGQPTDNMSHNGKRLSRQFRCRLARYIRTHSQHSPSSPEQAESQLQSHSEYPVPTELQRILDSLGLSNVGNSETSAERLGPDTARDFLFSGPSLEALCSNVRLRLYDRSSPILAFVKATVLAMLSKGESACCPVAPPDVMSASATDDTFCTANPFDRLHTIFIKTDWQPLAFLTAEFGDKFPPLGSIITYTGFVSCAFATTCSQYLSTFWPSTGLPFIRGLEKLVDSDNPYDDWITMADYHQTLLLKLKLSPDGSLLLQATAMPDILVQITQQTLWICSALRLAPETDTSSHFYSNGYICEQTIQPMAGCSHGLVVSCQFEEVTQRDHLCWLELVNRTAVLAHHFPIPSRTNEKGLEVPLPILCEMAGIRHAVEFQGGVVMKAPSAMLVPINRTNDIVQWHFIASSDTDQRFSFQDGLRQCQSRALINVVDLDALQSTRAVVGWCKRVRNMMGREEVDYEKIDFSKALCFSSPINFSGGAIGFQQFGAAHLNFTLGPKDSNVRILRSGNLQKILKIAGRTHVVLYDTADQRAWLVNADDVILHIIQTRASGTPLVANEKSHLLEYTESSSRTLQSNAKIQLPDTGENVGDMVSSIWSMLECLLDQEGQADKSTDRPVKLPLKQKIHGFEFMELVEERSPLRKKESDLESTSGGWPGLIKDIHALVLFGRGFDDLLQPASGTHGLCHSLRIMPKGQDFLGTTVPVLRDLYATAGCRLTHEYLTSSHRHLYWHSEDMLFEPCKEPQNMYCSCNRLQEVCHSRFNIIAPGLLEDEGGVIFGKPGSGLRLHRAIKPFEKRVSRNNTLYKHVNASLPLTDSGSASGDGESQNEDTRKTLKEGEVPDQEEDHQGESTESGSKGLGCRSRDRYSRMF